MPITPDVLSKYKNQIFIETGTGAGGGIECALACNFPKIISIEIDTNIYNNAINKFPATAYPNINLLNGNSAYYLSTLIMEDLRIRNLTATFWLDAHINDNKHRYNAVPNPILQELSIIFASQVVIHTILIDDRRLFLNRGIPLWQNISESAILQKVPIDKYNITYENGFVENDIIVLKPKRL